jgi:hypothetical protein
LQAILLRHLQIEQKNVGKELITELAGFFAISGFSYNSEVFLRFENGTQAMPNDRVIVRYNHSYLLRRNLERCFHDRIGTPSDRSCGVARQHCLALKSRVSTSSWEMANIGGEGKRILGACQPRKRPLCQDGEVSRKRES